MNKIKHITDKELNECMNLKKNIEFGSNEPSIMLSEEELDSRVYYKKIKVLDNYIEKIKETNIKADGKGILEIFKDDMQYAEELLNYKNNIQDDLNRLEVCSKCKCLGCSITCSFRSCMECSPNVKVIACDKSRFYITEGYENIDLYLGDTLIHYKILGILQDIKLDKKYIYLVEVGDINNQQLLEYKKYLNGKEEFNGIEGKEYDRVWNTFLKFNVCK